VQNRTKVLYIATRATAKIVWSKYFHTLKLAK
jgi:hypothetical protein